MIFVIFEMFFLTFGLCSSTPRGDGNYQTIPFVVSETLLGLCSSTPRGDGNSPTDSRTRATARVYAAQPREGTETPATTSQNALSWPRGLCSSTPRGDGNAHCSSGVYRHYAAGVYAAQPREGTETRRPCRRRPACHTTRFMQLNPARGRKHRTWEVVILGISRFMQLNPARGRKLLPSRWRSGLSQVLGLCSSTPRGDGNSI